MLCDKCKQNNATYHSTVNINGKITETHLCDACASNNKLFTFNNFLNPTFDPFVAESYEPTCDVCGYTLSDFKQTGMLGCPNCYKVFKDVINKNLLSIQPSYVHIGKRSSFNSDATITDSVETKIKLLELKLKQAVLEENYELASTLKKEIISLKEGNNNE